MGTVSGAITIPVNLIGISGSAQLNALVDTGFWGPSSTIAIPEIYVNILGLMPTNLESGFIIANSESMNMKICFGFVKFENIERPLLINVSPKITYPIVGMQFLNSFDCSINIQR